MIVELIPYTTFKQKIKIVKEQLKLNRKVEIWDKYIYSEGEEVNGK